MQFLVDIIAGTRCWGFPPEAFADNARAQTADLDAHGSGPEAQVLGNLLV